MRSAASLKGHPIHPMLIPFPFAFLFGSVAMDALATWRRRERWGYTGETMQSLGIGTALVAAVPGLVDYLFTVPPESSGKRRATRHMLSNLAAVALFTAARTLRRDSQPTGPSLGLAAAGAALMSLGGWLGGTLVYRNEIGVDVRYAGAGKWKETQVPLTPGQPVLAARSDELEIDQMKLVRVDGRRIVLARTREGYVAFDDRCSHRGGSLAGGTMIHGTVQCPWHGSQFATATGAVERGPATIPIGTYRVDEVNGEVRIHIPPPATALPG